MQEANYEEIWEREKRRFEPTLKLPNFGIFTLGIISNFDTNFNFLEICQSPPEPICYKNSSLKRCWYLYSQIWGYKFQIFEDFSKSLQKPWKVLQGPFVKHLKKLEEIVGKFKSYQNFDICTLRYEGTYIQIFGDFQNHFESLGKCCGCH